MITVVFVKWGDWCSPHSTDYVNHLAAAVARNLSRPHRFVCYTDRVEGLNPEIETRPLPGNLKGWWWDNVYTHRKLRRYRSLLALPYRFLRKSDPRAGIDEDRWLSSAPIDLRGYYNKLFLFKKGNLTGKCLYIDLDTIIVGSLDDLTDYDGDFCILRDFHHNLHYGSGLMMFRPEATEQLWRDFVELGCPILQIGDQQFIEERLPDADYFQDRHPGQVVSYKVHCRRNGVPPYARVVCFHGEPRPHEIEDPELLAAWKGS